LSAYTGQLQVYAYGGLGAVAAQKVTVSSNTLALDYMRFVSDVGVSQTLRQTFAYNGASNFSYGNAIFLVPGATNTLTGVVENLSSPSSSMALNSAVVIPNNFNAAFEIVATNGPLTFTNFISGPWSGNSGVLRLIKTGTYAATLSGVNEFTGSVSVSQGTLNANSATALGLATSTAGITVTSGATLSLGVAPTYASRSLTIGGTGVSSTVGALVIANTGTSAFQSITLGSTTYIRATNSGSILSPFTPANNSIILGASAGSDFIPFASLSNVFSGTGSVTYGGHSGDTGIVRADVRHTYTGNTTLAYGTTYVASSLELPATGGPLGNKSLTAANTLLMDGGILSYLDGNVDYSGRFSTAGGQQWRIAAGTATTFATALVGASSLRLFGGSLTLSSASSTFSGGVTLTEGTLYAGAAQSGVSGPLGITGTITFSPAGTGVLGYTAASAAFDYSSRFATSSGQSRRINANGESVTFSTAMGGDNELRLVGSAGTLTLVVANTYTQGTTLSVGTLKCGNAASLGTGGLAQANNTTLHVTATGGKLTIQGAHTNTGIGNRTIRIGA
jgi:autotransporter-associated beta strand protein